MRNIIRDLIKQYGYNGVLHEIVFLAGDSLTPREVGFNLAYKAAADLSEFCRMLDNAESNRKQREGK